MAVVLFATSPIAAECVYWFSASSFTWALLLTLAALRASQRADRGAPSDVHPAAMAACWSFLAPMGSAVGLLAGPLAMIRLGPSDPKGGVRSHLRRVLPMLGTVAALAFAAIVRHRVGPVEPSLGFGEIVGGLGKVAEAPAALLIGGLLGIVGEGAILPRAAARGSGIAGLAIVAMRLRRAEPGHRRGLLAAGFLVIGPYLLIFGVRASIVGDESLLRTQRYHLLPMAGLSLLIPIAWSKALQRLDPRPTLGLGAVAALALAMTILHRPMFEVRASYLRCQTDQMPVLRSLDRLSATARRLGIDRSRVLAALDPVTPRWSYAGGNILEMLPETADGDRAALPPPLDLDADRDALLAALGPGDRRALFAEMDASSYLVAAEPAVADRGSVEGRGVIAFRLQPIGAAGHYQSLGWPSCLEYEFPDRTEAGPDHAATLRIPAIEGGRRVQLWWAGDDRRWSIDRSVTLPGIADGGLLRLGDLPHWDGPAVRRVRIVVLDRGPLAITGQPALIR